MPAISGEQLPGKVLQVYPQSEGLCNTDDYRRERERVYASFSKTVESAGALDGWSAKEMGLLSKDVCESIATLLNQIEEGAQWPRSAPHAMVVYLQKEGAEVGQVMGYRPLTITAPLYRCWATMRLADLQEWIDGWALPEMYAGVPGRGAVDAWREVLTTVENLKLDGKNYCGGVADIAKLFDQIQREVVYRLAEAAGMPPQVLVAYKS